MSLKQETVDEVIDILRAEIILEHRFPRQRPLSKSWVHYLAVQQKAGLFKQGTQITICHLGDEWWLTNGQHTLSAITESGVPQQLSVLHIWVRDIDEANHLYSIEDRHRSRTTNDMIRAYDMHEKYDISASKLSAIFSASRFIDSGFMGSSHTKYSVNDTLLTENIAKWVEYGKQYFTLIQGCDADKLAGLQRSASLSVGMAILRADGVEDKNRIDAQERAAEFLYQTALSKSPDTGVRQLQYHIVNTFMPSGHATKRVEAILHSSYAARYVAACWNAWILQRPFVEPTKYDQARPIHIVNTSFVNPAARY